MILMGTQHYNSAWIRHKAIREALGENKKSLTVIEYCKFEGLSKEYVENILERSVEWAIRNTKKL